MLRYSILGDATGDGKGEVSCLGETPLLPDNDREPTPLLLLLLGGEDEPLELVRGVEGVEGADEGVEGSGLLLAGPC